MSERSKPEDLYADAVSDGTPEPKAEPEADQPLVVESNASNYGGSALPVEPPPRKAP